MKQGIFINLFIFWIVFMSPHITPGYMFNACYLKINDSNSLLCNSISPNLAYQHPPNCHEKDITITAMTMYVVHRCNSSSQCGTEIDCCNVSNETTTQVPKEIEHLNNCKREKCLRIPLSKLPFSGSYYRVIRINYSCVEDGFPIAGYVIIPLVIVLVAVVVGLVWRYRKRLFEKKQKEDSSYTATGNTGQSHATTVNKTYESSCVTKTTEDYPAYSGESGFDGYSEISAIENIISINHETEYNVLNLKNRAVKSDPNYGILSARPIDPDAFSFQVQKQNSGVQKDTYSHFGQTYKGGAGNDNTYDSTHVAAKDKDKAGLTDNKEEDTYNHIETTQAVFSQRGSAVYSKVTQPKF